MIHMIDFGLAVPYINTNGKKNDMLILFPHMWNSFHQKQWTLLRLVKSKIKLLKFNTFTRQPIFIAKKYGIYIIFDLFKVGVNWACFSINKGIQGHLKQPKMVGL